MKKITIVLILLAIAIKGFSQLNFGCETTSAFPKSTTPDLGIVIYSNDSETAWNAFRLATLSQSKGDTVVIFLIGKGIDPFMKEGKEYDIKSLHTQFVAKGGQVIVCGTCAKQRGTDEVKLCTIASIVDLYEIVKRSKKVLTF
jgi:uncharacterized protein involved in oxidation of intracellular sulfur